MNRRTGTWIGVGCLVLLVLVAIPIGLAIWAFSGSTGVLGRLNPNPALTSAAQMQPTALPNVQEGPLPTEAIPQTGTNQTTVNQGDMGNLAAQVVNPPENLEALFTEANPGTVAILVEINQNGQTGAGAGSGFVLTDAGYIITNHHVIQGAQNVYVTFYDGVTLPAQVVGSTPDADIALIKVDQLPQNVHPLPLANLGDVRVGDPVVAIGNPFALGNSMTYGIVSALGRVIPSGFTQYNIPEAIQTDAAINPGNSGGPLINMNGEVIGVNAQIRTSGQGGGNLGIGFAIPVNIVKLVYPSLIQTGSYTWPYLGVAGGPISPAVVQQFGLAPDTRGAFIGQVTPNTPADQAGLQAGDVVVQADNQNITSFDDLLSYVAFKKPGDQINLVVQRGGQQFQTTVTLGARPEGQNVQ